MGVCGGAIKYCFHCFVTACILVHLNIAPVIEHGVALVWSGVEWDASQLYVLYAGMYTNGRV
jgi:hypothetical protein